MLGQRVEGSKLFSVEKKGDQNYLQTEFIGDGFTARNIQEKDLPFYEKLFSDVRVVALYADGKPKDAAWVQGRFATWNGRFLACQPHGGLTVFNSETNEPIGHVVAGIGGPGPGVSEVAAAFEVSSQKQGICTQLLKAVVEDWAPEVRKIGLGEIKDSRFPDLADAFKCFGGEALSRLDATYYPNDFVSEKILKNAGFVAAQTALCTDNVFDLTNTGLSFSALEDLERITQLFFEKKDGKESRSAKQRYVCRDENGTHTISFKDHFRSFRFHVEKSVGGVGM